MATGPISRYFIASNRIPSPRKYINVSKQERPGRRWMAGGASTALTTIALKQCNPTEEEIDETCAVRPRGGRRRGKPGDGANGTRASQELPGLPCGRSQGGRSGLQRRRHEVRGPERRGRQAGQQDHQGRLGRLGRRADAGQSASERSRSEEARGLGADGQISRGAHNEKAR